MNRLNIEQLARQKAVDEQREINMHVVAIETEIPYQSLKRYASGESQSVPLARLTTLMRYFDCSYEELVIQETNASPESNAPTVLAGA